MKVFLSACAHTHKFFSPASSPLPPSWSLGDPHTGRAGASLRASHVLTSYSSHSHHGSVIYTRSLDRALTMPGPSESKGETSLT